MGLFKNRPLAILCFLFSLTLAVCALFGAIFHLVLTVVALFVLFALAALILFRRARRCVFLCFCIMSVTVGSFWGLLLFGYTVQGERFGDLRVTVEGTVSEVCRTDQGTNLYVFTESLNGKRMHGILYATGIEGEVRTGDTVCFEASLTYPSEWGDDERYFSLSDGVFARARLVSDFYVTEETVSLPLRLLCTLSLWRNGLSDRLLAGVEGDGGALMSAMLLGKRDLLSPVIARDFKRAGLSHILCISGFHLALLGGLVLRFFRACGLSRRACYASMAGAVIFYAALTGFPVSVVRAGVMLILVALSKILFRRADGMTSLAVAAAFILFVTPCAVYDYGFWLSVVATFGILVYSEWRKKRQVKEERPFWRRALSAAAESLCVTLSAIFATLPLSAVFFGETSLIAPLTNILLLPLLEGYLILSLPALLLSASPISPLFAFCGQAILRAVSFFADLRGIVISLDYLSVKILLFLLLGTVIFLLCLPKARRRLCLLTILPQIASITILLIFLQAFLFSQNALSYTINDKNELFVLYSKGKGLVCDSTSGGYEATAAFEEALSALRLTECEGYLLTHYHKEHTESTRAILSRYKVRTLYLPTPRSKEDDVLRRQIKKDAASLGVRCVYYTEKDYISIGNLDFSTLVSPMREKHRGSIYAVRGREDILLYLDGVWQTKEKYTAAVGIVQKATHLIFGAHTSEPREPIPYVRFSARLRLVLLRNPGRLPAAVKAAFDARKIPYYTQKGSTYIPLN